MASIPAVEYIRVSTGGQQCSIQRQRQAIRTFAKQYGFDVVSTYIDSGKSGVTLAGRKGLKALLASALSGRAPFRAVLVYDVSRWGRFQDVDEGAYYEFACKRFGIPVLFCAEGFSRQPTVSDSIAKSIKRVMAAEYSRELSIKCFRGQRRIAELGFSAGGSAPYGLRRVCIAPDGVARTTLQHGEHKNISADRVSFVLGPRSERDCIMQIFNMACNARMSPNAIATYLNQHHVASPRQKQWSNGSIQKILRNPRYVGCNAWNRSSWKLGGRVIRNARPLWVVKEHAFPAVIPKAMFMKVQRVLENRQAVRRKDSESYHHVL